MAADQAAWLDRLDAELGNLRAAIAFSLAQPDLEPGLRLAASLRVYWMVRGHAPEGAGVLRVLLDAPTAQGTSLPRARALVAAARLFEATGGYAIAEDYCQEALAIARAAGDDYMVAELLQIRAWVLLRQGPHDAALPLIEQGLGLSRRLQEPRRIAMLLSVRSSALDLGGDLAGAARDAAQSLQLFRKTGDQRAEAMALGDLGTYELQTGDLDAARRHLAESLDIFRALNDHYGVAYEAFNLGLAEYLGGSSGAAEALFAEALDLARRMGMKAHTAYVLIGLAMAGRGADPGWSARMHGTADQVLADLGHALEPLEAQLADLDRQQLRATMGEAAFEAEYAAGRAFDPAHVLAALSRQDAVAGPPRVTGPGADVTVLTPRELDVLKLVAQGLSNPDIAQRLFLSEHTVHRHLANILRKLNLSSRAAAAAWGVRAGLV